MNIKLSVALAGVLVLTNSSVLAADYVNSIGMEFNNIPAGDFYMGSCQESSADKEDNTKRQFMGQSALGAACPSGAGIDKDASDNETPQHRVNISRGFQMGVYEVTLGQFKQFIASAGRDDLLTADFMKYNNQGDDAPVVKVSWDDAQVFIRWLNTKEGGQRYRLPTEAEWEYASRAGTSSPYGFSGSFADYIWYEANSDSHQHSVGQKRPNAWGLYDTAGNVWEWTQDYYDKTYYRNSPTTDPEGASSGTQRVLRGGSWGSNASLVRSASRDGDGAADRDRYLGFRLSRM